MPHFHTMSIAMRTNCFYSNIAPNGSEKNAWIQFKAVLNKITIDFFICSNEKNEKKNASDKKNENRNLNRARYKNEMETKKINIEINKWRRNISTFRFLFHFILLLSHLFINSLGVNLSKANGETVSNQLMKLKKKLFLFASTMKRIPCKLSHSFKSKEKRVLAFFVHHNLIRNHYSDRN